MIWTDGDGACRGVPARARVVAGHACGTPLTLLAAPADHAEHVGGVTPASEPLLGDPPLAPAMRSGALRVQGGQADVFVQGGPMDVSLMVDYR